MAENLTPREHSDLVTGVMGGIERIEHARRRRRRGFAIVTATAAVAVVVDRLSRGCGRAGFFAMGYGGAPLVPRRAEGVVGVAKQGHAQSMDRDIRPEQETEIT